MRNRPPRPELRDLCAVDDHRHSMRALARVTTAVRAAEPLAEVVDLEVERHRRRPAVVLLDPQPA